MYRRLCVPSVPQPMLFAPGRSWSFSDTNFVLLGEILRRVGGMPVSEQIRKRVLIPLLSAQARQHPALALPRSERVVKVCLQDRIGADLHKNPVSRLNQSGTGLSEANRLPNVAPPVIGAEQPR